MTFKDLKGRERNVSIKRYQVDWDGRRVSGPQGRVRDFLRPFWRHHVVCEEFAIPGAGRMRADFVNVTERVMVEVSPVGSHEWNPFFHKTLAGYRAALKRDMEKTRWALLNNLIYVEITDTDLDCLNVAFARQGVVL